MRKYDRDVPPRAFTPEIPSPLRESSAASLEWPRLRDYLASRTFSPLGRDWILALEPSADLAWIDNQQQRTAEMRTLLSSGVTFDFHGLFAPADLLDKSRIQGAALEPVEILSLITVIDRIVEWANLILSNSETNAQNRSSTPALEQLSAPLRERSLSPLLRQLSGKIEPDGSLSDDASPELHRIRRAIDRQHRAIEESLRRSLRRLSEDGSTRDELITIRGDRFVIPVRAEFKRRVPGVVHGSSSSGQTVFVEPLETIEQNNELVRLLEEEQSEIHRILVAMTRAIAADASAIEAGAVILAEVESHAARARFAADLNCVRPTFTPADQNRALYTSMQGGAANVPTPQNRVPHLRVAKVGSHDSPQDTPSTGKEGVILSGSEAAVEGSAVRQPSPGSPFVANTTYPADQVPHLRGEAAKVGSQYPSTSTAAPSLALTAARHPLLELRMIAEARAAGTEAAHPVPLTVALSDDARQLIISGPNTGGKTVSLKTIGLLSLMAQAGIPVPAVEAQLPLFTGVYADIGDAQSIERNLSSFSAHVVNLDRISRDADSSSLVLLDELGSATDPEEGAALAVAVAQHFLRARAWCCITTHLTSLKVYAANNAGVLNAAVGFDQETLTPTYQLRLGVPGASAGLNIAARLGLDPAIVASARAQLTTQTADIAAFLDQLHDQLAAAAQERESLRMREQELARARMQLDLEGRAEQRARTRELEAKLNALLENFSVQLRESVKNIGDKAAAKRIQRDSALALARARREFSSEFQSTIASHTAAPGAPGAARPAVPIAPKVPETGDLVTLKSLGREGRIERILDEKTFEVSVGPMKMRVALDDITQVVKGRPVTPLEAARRRGGITVSTADDPDTISSEINVIGRTADEAQDEVARFVDRAFLAGLPRIRIVHGTGMGILRRTLRDYLRNHPHVASITEPPPNLGGQGATEVELRQ